MRHSYAGLAGGRPTSTVEPRRHPPATEVEPATAADAAATCGDEAAGFDQVLQRLRTATGVDFAGYRRGTVERRVRSRMRSANARSLGDYCDRLDADPDEAERLLQCIAIKVSRFFRDADTFDALQNDVLPALAARAAGRPLAIWSAGCSHGEEPYSIAMLLDELGIDGTVMATDIDGAALARAEAGVFRHDAVAALPLLRRLRCFMAGDSPQTVRIHPSLHRRVRFVRHDLAGPAPVDGGPFDLICCRNVMIYFGRDGQLATMRRLLAMLRPGGCLCLGEAEWPLPEVMPWLRAMPRRWRLFERIEGERTCVEP